MTFVSLEKTLDHLTVQESLRSENLTEYYLFLYLCIKEHFDLSFSTPKQISSKSFMPA